LGMAIPGPEVDGLGGEFQRRNTNKSSHSYGKDVIVRWIRPPSATTMGIYPMAGARPSKPITKLQMGSLPGWFGYAT